jgi:PTS system fructose-specific IIC component
MFFVSIAVGAVVTALILIALKRWVAKKPVEAEQAPVPVAA